MEQMTADVFDLAEKGQAAVAYRNQTFEKIGKVVQNDFLHHCWVIPTDRVFPFPVPLPIPKNTFNPGTQRMNVSYDLSAQAFDAITKLGPRVNSTPTEREEEEGRRSLRIHQRRERNPRLVANFKASLASLACTVCEFDFGKAYGDHGVGYIECHHTKPVAQMKPGDKTRITDLRAVCSNCHRMLHRTSPMLTVDELRELLR